MSTAQPARNPVQAASAGGQARAPVAGERPPYPPRPDELAPGPRRLYRRGRRRVARVRPTPARPAPARVEGPEESGSKSPSMLSMVKIVAISVVLIVLVSFAAGYGFGRLFL